MSLFRKTNIEVEEEKEKKWFKSEGKLTVDVYETDSHIIIQSAVAGVDVKDLDISIENDMLEIKGKREKPDEGDKKKYYFQECYWGPFSRRLIIPKEVDNSKVNASMKEGVLVIKLPKLKRERKRKVKLKKKEK